MTHLTEEEMIAKAYGESENTAAVERHLRACPLCADGFAELKRDLADIDRIEAPARDLRYGDRVWAAIAGALPAYALRKRALQEDAGEDAGDRVWWNLAGSGFWSKPWNNLWVKGLGYAAACALLVSSAFYAGRVWQMKQAPAPVAHVETPKAQAPRTPIVVVVLDDHLDRSERFLVELKHADLDSSAMESPLRDEARSLLAANRVCRKNVGQADDPELTTALDHLDSLLADAANEPGGLNAKSIAELQQTMNAEGLLFEVRVLRSRIGHRAPVEDPERGGTI
jgi:hypothetical protein